MSAFKSFTTNDVVITPFNINKDFSFTGNNITGSNVGIDIYSGKNISPYSTDSSGFIFTRTELGVYNSIKQLYYTNYLTSSLGDDVPLPQLIPGVTPEFDEQVGNLNAPRFENYLQSSTTQSRFFPTGSNAEISVVSIPVSLFGENIVPTTFKLTYTSSIPEYFDITDDGEGNLISGSQIVGQIFYSHGNAVFTSGSLSTLGTDISSTLENLKIDFLSSLTIYENQYKCVINENEFLFSQNPTLLSGSLDDQYYDFVTSSIFTPYITTVGLYNDSNELLLVGKLSSPIPISKQNDTTIIVNFDML
jgi:hypothetical protein